LTLVSGNGCHLRNISPYQKIYVLTLDKLVIQSRLQQKTARVVTILGSRGNTHSDLSRRGL
jgi:hypothetical protein